MTYQRAAWKALYRLISEHQLSETESLAIAKSIFYPSVIEVPQACEDTPFQPEADRVVVKGFAGEQGDISAKKALTHPKRYNHTTNGRKALK